MQSILDKARALTLGTLHELLDRQINNNSIPVLKQYLRDLEEARDDMADSTAVARSRVTRMKQELAAKEASIITTTENIELILGDGDTSNDHHAETMAANLITLEADIESRKLEIVELDEAATALATALSRVNTKHADSLANLNRLERLASASEAKGAAAKALNQLGSATGSGPSIDAIESKIRDTAAVNDARFDQAMEGNQPDAAAAVLSSKAQQRVAEIRARLQAAESTAAS